MRVCFSLLTAIFFIFFGVFPISSVQAQNNLLFILDSSGSMQGKLEGQTKMDTAKTALSALVSDLPKDTKIGLMAYGHRLSRKDLGACNDIELITPVGNGSAGEIVNSIKAINAKGKTPIAEALRQAPAAFPSLEQGNNNIVLISDGIETCGGDACAVAGELARSNINLRVHVVGFDISEKDRTELECIARLGKGKYFAANSTGGFSSAVTNAVQVAQVETKPKPIVPAKPTIYFEDNFEGEELAEDWEVVNPNPDAFIIEDGKLLIVGDTPGNFAKRTVNNLFKLSKPLPKGDWTITAKLSVEFQTVAEKAVIGIFDSEKKFIEISIQSWITSLAPQAIISIFGRKQTRDKAATSFKVLWKGVKYEEGKNFTNNAKSLPQPILLRLQKRGRSYTGSIRLGKAKNGKQPGWTYLDKFTVLRLKGSVVFGFFQKGATRGESIALFDWIKIETP